MTTEEEFIAEWRRTLEYMMLRAKPPLDYTSESIERLALLIEQQLRAHYRIIAHVTGILPTEEDKAQRIIRFDVSTQIEQIKFNIDVTPEKEKPE